MGDPYDPDEPDYRRREREEREREDRYYGDMAYEVWRRGGNPDEVTLEDARDSRDDAMFADEAGAAFVRSRGRTRRLEDDDDDDV